MLITTPEQFLEVSSRWDLANHKIGLDFETNGGDPWSPQGRLVGVSLAGWTDDGWSGCYVPLAHQSGPNCLPAVLHELADLLSRAVVVPFYAQMEVPWAAAKLAVVLTLGGDAYIAARLLQLPGKSGLKDLTEAVLKRSVIRFEDLIPAGTYDFSVVPSDDPRVLSYTVADALNGVELEAVLRKQVEEAGLGPVYEVEIRATGLMSRATLGGYFVSPAALAEAVSVESARLRAIEADIYRLCGGPSFLINSSQQVAKQMARLGVESPLKTETGAPSWNMEALGLVEQKHPVVPRIIDWRKTFSFVNNAKPLQPAEDGRVHPTWQVIGQKGSARMHAEKPPLTTLPETVRRVFVAPPHGRWIRLKWVDPELRMLALLSRDEELLAILKTPDPWAAMADRLGCAREDAERFVFTYIRHGGEPAHVTERMTGWSSSQVWEAGARFAHIFPGVVALLVGVEVEVARDRKVRTWLNRTWKIEDAESDHDLRVKAWTAITQQSVATALKVCLSLLASRALMGQAALRWVTQVLPVFDTVFYCIPDDLPLKDHLEVMRQVFELSLSRDLDLKMEVVFAEGPTWGNLTEVTSAERS